MATNSWNAVSIMVQTLGMAVISAHVDRDYRDCVDIQSVAMQTLRMVSPECSLSSKYFLTEYFQVTVAGRSGLAGQRPGG